jgi:hypothetical protein
MRILIFYAEEPGAHHLKISRTGPISFFLLIENGVKLQPLRVTYNSDIWFTA